MRDLPVEIIDSDSELGEHTPIEIIHDTDTDVSLLMDTEVLMVS